ERVVAEFSGTNADSLLDRIDEDLAVADAPGLGCVADGLDRLFGEFVRAHDLDLHLGQEVHHIFGAAIELGMALLAAETLGFGHGDALQANFLQRFLDLVELERLYDSLDFLHLSLQVLQTADSANPYARPVPCGHFRKNLNLCTDLTPVPAADCGSIPMRVGHCVVILHNSCAVGDIGFPWPSATRPREAMPMRP